MSLLTLPSRSSLWRRLTLLATLFVLFSGCEPEFTDQFCETDLDCFSFEACMDGVCERLPPVVPEDPVIDLFEADPAEINPGESVVFRWRTSHATRLVLSESPGSRTKTITNAETVAEGEDQLSFNVTTTMRLTARNSEGEEVSEEVTVTVIPPEPDPTEGPVITSFSASATRVDVGAEVTLSWTSERGRVGSILDDYEVLVDLTRAELDEGSVTVTVTEGTVYRLRIENNRGVAQDSIPIVLDLPTIDSFIVATQSAIVGDPVTLSWETTNADTLTLTGPGGEDVDLAGAPVAAGSVVVSPETGDIYTLTATNGNGSVSQPVTIQMLERLSIKSFSANAALIRIGESVVLSWEIEGGATTVAIADQNGTPVTIPADQLVEGSVTVSPAEDTTYTLTASNATQSEEASLEVDVRPPDPTVTSFTVNTTPVLPGASVTLTWAIDDLYLESVEILGLGGAPLNLAGKILAGDSIQVVIGETTTFTLRATNAGGTTEATVTVNVQGAVSIPTFMGSNNNFPVDPSTAVTLSWTTLNATAVSLVANIDGSQVPVNISDQPLSGGTIVVNPTRDTTYTLTAQGLPSPAVRSVTVNIHRPTVSSFTVTGESGIPNVVIAGEKAVLSWTTNRATIVSIQTEPGGLLDTAGLSAASGSLEHTPTVDTTYTLIASNGSYVSDAVARPVSVVAPLEISQFGATPTTVDYADPVTLSWQTTGGATSGRIVDAQGNIYPILAANLASGTMEVTPIEATTYTLEITNAYQTVSSSAVSVSVIYPTLITSFEADVASVISGGAAQLSWETNMADSIALCVQGGACLDLAGLAINSDSITVRPQVTTTYVFTVQGPGGPSSETLEVEVTAAPLQISEVFYNTTNNAGGLQWVELHNTGDTFVDLANYSIGSGSNDYTTTRVQLSGWLAPRGSFLVGGASTLDNFEPALDQTTAFNPSLGLGGAQATGVGLFFSPASAIDAASVPVDAVVYGDSNSGGLIGPDGAVMTELTSAAAQNESIVRVSATSAVFAVEAEPSPGRTFHVLSLSPTSGVNDVEVTLTITGYGFDLALDGVSVGNSDILSCIEIATGLECIIPPTSELGLVDITIVREGEYVQNSEGETVLGPGLMEDIIYYVISDAYEFLAP